MKEVIKNAINLLNYDYHSFKGVIESQILSKQEGFEGFNTLFDFNVKYFGREMFGNEQRFEKFMIEDIFCFNSNEYIPNYRTLIYLDCSSNVLTSLDVSKNTALIRLECEDNQLTSLDVSNNTALTYLECEHNQLTSLDISNNTALNYLECDDKNPFFNLKR